MVDNVNRSNYHYIRLTESSVWKGISFDNLVHSENTATLCNLNFAFLILAIPMENCLYLNQT